MALVATAHEISGMLMPTKVRKSDVLRITLRRRDNVLLERILIGNVDDGDAKDDRYDVDDDIIAGGESSLIYTGEGLAHRIGNLALVSSLEPRIGISKKGSGSFLEIKTMRYKKEPWILTRQVAESDKWDVDEVHDQQKDVFSLMEYVWS